ncbi:MAG TPA: cytochrome c-type biogenesis protein CcmH [Polyangiaceae bacterium]|nr:cytochrome c-type biogenesis protein CcmH [Polyangiaceae bacterium]
MTKVPARSCLPLGLLLSALLLANPALGSDPAPAPEAAGAHGAVSAEQARRAGSIARQTMSPFCPGRTLADCPSNYAAEWRDDIRAMVARGMSDDEIQRELFGRAGGDLSGIPHREVSYAVPISLGALALGVLGWVLWRLSKNRAAGSSALAGATAPAATSEGTQAGANASTASAAAPSSESTIDEQRLESELAAEGDDD